VHQRMRRYKTPAPPVRIPSDTAHRLTDAWTSLGAAENTLRLARPDDPRVRLVLTLLEAVHREMDPLLAPVTAALSTMPRVTPPPRAEPRPGGRPG